MKRKLCLLLGHWKFNEALTTFSDKETMLCARSLYLTLLFSLLALSPAKGRQSNLEVKSYDLTKNGKPDRFETYEKGVLKSIQEDRNGDGNVDYVKTFYGEENKEIELQDLNHNGKFERRVTTKPLREGKLERVIELDQNEDGVFEYQSMEILNSIQKQDSCYERVIFDQINALAREGLIVSADLNQGFLATGSGYLVDRACLKNWGPRFPEYLKDSMTVGLQCLADLQKKFGAPNQMTGALRNAFELSRLLESDQVKIVCSEAEYDWEGTAGHASTAPSDKIEKLNVGHPFISLNPHDPKSGNSSSDPETLNELRKTIFHEQLHNLGFRHGHDIEYPYACEECCLSVDGDPELKDSACRVCAGRYQNEVDPEYVKDFINFSQLNYQNSRGLMAATRYMKENPKSSLGISFMALSSADIFNPVGPKLGRLILSKHSLLSSEELSHVMKSIEYEDEKHFKPLSKSSDSLAQAMYALYYEQDAETALNIVSANKEAIAQELYDAVESSSRVNYSAESATEILDQMIYDIWINRFPKHVDGSEARSDQAYELQLFFEEKEVLR